jgi:predicted DCC family thiol-disulfide oxidoreductase YuxK
MGRPESPRLLFDGDCGFCQQFLRWLERGSPELRSLRVPFQHVDLLAAGVEEQQCRREVVLLSSEPPHVGGAAALAGWMRHGRATHRAAAVVLLLPGVRGAAAAVYRVVARSRHRLPASVGQACDLPSRKDIEA